MLLQNELDAILAKDRLKLEDLILLEHHLLSIQKTFDQYRISENEVDMDVDVYNNLNRDISLILEKLQKERKQGEKPRLTLLTND